MICPNCREDNASSFRFCGMCGTSLEPRRKTGAAALDPLSAFPAPPPPPKVTARTANLPEPVSSMVLASATNSVSTQVPPISGPSMLGLDIPVASQSSQFGLNESARSEPRPSERVPGEPSLDSLREKSFAGLDSFLEPEQTNTGLRRILLLMVLLVALGGAGWWTYTNYIDAVQGRKPEVATTSAGGAAPTTTPQPPPQSAPPTAVPDSSPAPTASTQTAEAPSAIANTAADTVPTKTPDAAASPANETQIATTAPEPHVPPARTPTASKRESPFQAPPKRQPAAAAVRPNNVRSANVQPTNLSSTPGADTGDADFRRGESYLYGRGAAGNCDQAIKSLKAASAKSNAKARSAFGTMYATGHCVPRDLPTSYLWFALALRIDPNNPILEKDLSAIWNQMTPPERQMATRMKE